MEPYWDLIKRIVTESDLVLMVLDARMIELSRNEQVEEIIKEVGRPVIFVVNKSDLTSHDKIKRHTEKIKEKGEVVLFSAKKPGSAKLLHYFIKKVFKKYGKREMPQRDKYSPKPKYREALGDIVVGVLGYPNVGKSSIINALSHRKKVKVSKKAGTTHGIHWVKATNEIKLIDSPGVIPLKKDDEIRYGLIGARDIEKLKDPEVVSNAIIKLFLQHNKNALENFYQIEIKSDDPKEITQQIADKKRFLLKGGILDEYRAQSLIVRDWQQGRLIL